MSKNKHKRKYKHLNANDSMLLVPEAGELIRVVINTKGVAPNVLTLYDGRDTSGQVIAAIDTSVTVVTLEYHVRFVNGLYYALAGGTAADLTMVYDT